MGGEGPCAISVYAMRSGAGFLKHRKFTWWVWAVRVGVSCSRVAKKSNFRR
jgi:hypothetical protein